MVSTCKARHALISHVTNLIMLVEDDIDHAELIIRAAAEHSIPNQVCHFLDGQSALDHLYRRNNLSDPAPSPRPRVILLDMHLPGIDGIEILKAIKVSDELKLIPVIMLTTSNSESDMSRAYCNHANSYLVKSVGCEGFKDLMDTVCFYWLGNNMSPKI